MTTVAELIEAGNQMLAKKERAKKDKEIAYQSRVRNAWEELLADVAEQLTQPVLSQYLHYDDYGELPAPGDTRFENSITLEVDGCAPISILIEMTRFGNGQGYGGGFYGSARLPEKPFVVGTYCVRDFYEDAAFTDVRFNGPCLESIELALAHAEKEYGRLQECEDRVEKLNADRARTRIEREAIDTLGLTPDEQAFELLCELWDLMHKLRPQPPY